MKLLFVGPLRDFSGYAESSRHILKGLRHAGADLVCRHVKYDDGATFIFDDEEEQLFRKPLQDIDAMFQMTTPNEARVHPGLFNIIMFYWETTSIPQYWVQQLNKFDLIVVPCEMNAIALKTSGVLKPVVVSYPMFDSSIYEKEYATLEIDGIENKILFYNICQLSPKKGIDSLLKAYFTGFADVRDQVLLVLKTYINMTSRQNEQQIIENFIGQIKKGLRIPEQYLPKILLLTDIMNFEEIQGLHKTCHCYVNSSRGEGWCSLPGSKVLTRGGYINIENVGLYQEVLTHTGKWRKIKNLLQREYCDNIYKINTYYHHELKLTGNHNVLTKRGWIRADELTSEDYIAINKNIESDDIYPSILLREHYNYIDSPDGPRYINHNQYCGEFGGKLINIPKEFFINDRFANLLGLYIAEGSGIKQAKFAVNTLERDRLIKEIIELALFDGITYTIEEGERNRSLIEINNTALAKILMNLCGHLAPNKHLPSDYQHWNKKILIELIKGYWLGDGTYDESRNSISFSTTSKRLAYEVRHALQILDFVSSVRHRDKKDGLDEYVVKISKCQVDKFINMMDGIFYENRTRQQKGKFDEDRQYFFVKIRDIQIEQYNGVVYNLSVDKDESYTLDDLVVHNCVPAFEAMAHGNLVVSNQWGGMKEYVTQNNALIYGGQLSPVYEMFHGDPTLYTGLENWFEPNIVEMRQQMRNVFGLLKSDDMQHMNAVSSMTSAAQAVTRNFDYKKLGKPFYQVIEKAYNIWKEKGQLTEADLNLKSRTIQL